MSNKARGTTFAEEMGMVIMLITSWVGGSMLLCLALLAAAARRMPQNDQNSQVAGANLNLGLAKLEAARGEICSSVAVV